jgi:uncharacterized membrane protein
MNLTLKRPIMDILLCLLWSLILLPIALTDLEGPIRIILGLPFLLFIPGYLLIFALFPLRKTSKDIDTIERIALGFALSLAIIPIIGLGLNYTPWGLQLVPILLSLIVFIFGVGAIALYRWYRVPHQERLITTLTISLPKLKKNLDTVITIILILTIIFAPASLIYVMLTPKTDKPFTEFYILNQEGIAGDYQRNLAIGEDTNVIIGIKNHEHKTMEYTIEIWLLNQTIVHDIFTDKKEIIYDHLWYINKINIVLDHTSADIEELWEPQWEHNLSFNITKKGNFKLLFLLFDKSTEEYTVNKDYKNIVDEKINGAYSTTNMWLSVSNLPKIYDVLTTPQSTVEKGFVNISCKIFDADGIDEVFLNILGPKDINEYFSITANNTGVIYYCNRTYTVAGEYRYFIWANDTTNNFSRYTDQFYITDIPMISNIWTSPPSTQQNGFLNISCFVYDFDGIKEISLNITNPDGKIENFSIINNKTGLYIYYSNQIYNTIGIYNYYIWVNDTVGNTNTSDVKQFSVSSLPWIYDIYVSPTSIIQNESVNISCKVFDSDGVDKVFLNINYPDNTTKNFSIVDNYTGSNYYYNSTYKMIGEYSYFIWTTDIFGNINMSDIKKFSVNSL